MTNSSIPAPVTGPRHGPSLSDQLRLCRSLIGTDDKGGRDDARACIDRAAYVSEAALHALRLARGTLIGASDDAERAETLAAIRAALAAAEGRETTDAPKVEPAPADFEQRRDGWSIAFVPLSSAARQWSIDSSPKGARWEHERWYASRSRAPAVRHAIEAEGFTVREG